MTIVPYRLPGRIEDFFKVFVNKPFEEHEATDSWVREVVDQNWDYQTKTIVDRGRTDFSKGWNGLTSNDKILIYAYRYMQMHTVSGFHVFQRGFAEHRLNFLEACIFLDFGCGPLTSGIALAAHHLAERPDDKDGLTFHYIGIDRCEQMLAHASSASKFPGLFNQDSTFHFATPAQSLELIPRIVNDRRVTTKGNDLAVIISFSYLCASNHLQVGGLIAFISRLLKECLSKDKVCLVFQNPHNESLNSKWERFKRGVPELQGLSKICETVYYYDITGRDRKALTSIKLRREFLLNQNWLTSGEVIPF